MPVTGNPVNQGGQQVMMKSFLALGDSYTIGQGASIADRFPVQTRTILARDGINIKAPEILAVTGWTTSDLQDAINQKNFTSTYDVVTLLIGVNDQYRYQDTTGYRQRFQQLLLHAVRLADNRRNHVFVLSIPDYSVTPFAMHSDTAFIRSQIDMFNKINQEITSQEQCQYLDITASTRLARYDRSLLASDSLHPSGKEYEKWAMRLAPLIKAVL